MNKPLYPSIPDTHSLKSLFGTFSGIPNKGIDIGAKAVQIYEDKSIFFAPPMSDEEWQSMSEEHQATQLAADSKLLAMAADIVKDIQYLTVNELMAWNSGRAVK